MANDITNVILQATRTARRAAEFAPIGEIAEVMSALVTIVNAIINQIRKWNSNSESCRLILTHANSLSHLLGDLEKLVEKHELPPSFYFSLDQLYNRLIDCRKYCEDLSKKGKIQTLCLAGVFHPELQNLDDLLNKAIHDATLAVSSANLRVFIDYLYEEPHLEEVALYEHRRPSSNDKTQPVAVSKPAVKVNGSMLIVAWSDGMNLGKSLLGYDIQYRKGRRKSTTTLPPPSSVALELPPGDYSIQVRAINKYGPGPWSEATDVKVDGIPFRPPPPKAFRMSLKTAVIAIPRPSRKLKEGRMSTVCVLQMKAVGVRGKVSSETEAGRDEYGEWLTQDFEYVLMSDGQRLKSLRCKLHDLEHNREYQLRSIPMVEGLLDSESHTVVVSGLDPKMVYKFRIKMKNHIGSSNPSDSATADFIPSPPQFVYTAKREHNLIEIHWTKPQVLPEVVGGYEIEKRKTGEDWETATITAPNNRSVLITGLESQTMHFFRIHSLTETGQRGLSVEIEAKTRMHNVLKGGLATLAFAGGMLLAPIVAPIDHQIYTTRVVCKKVKKRDVPIGVPIAASISIAPVFFVVNALVWTAISPAYGGILAYRVYRGKLPFMAAVGIEKKKGRRALDLVNAECEFAETQL